MNLYDVMTIHKVSVEKRYEEAMKKITDFIKENGGEVVSVEFKGKKKRSYPTDGEDRGLYTFSCIKATPTLIMALDKKLADDEDVLLAFIIRAELRKEKQL